MWKVVKNIPCTLVTKAAEGSKLLRAGWCGQERRPAKAGSRRGLKKGIKHVNGTLVVACHGTPVH